jgi:hypothetical protein
MKRHVIDRAGTQAGDLPLVGRWLIMLFQTGAV